MADDLASEIIRNFDRAKSLRGIWESHWQEIAERVWPDRAIFVGTRPEGDKRTERIFDGTASLALPRFGAAMESMLTPRTQKWHKLTVQDEDLAEDYEVKRYLDAVNGLLFRARYAPGSNFASQMFEAYMSIGAFGTGCLFTDEMVGRGLRYKSIHLGELFLSENHVGQIDRVFRKFEYSARQAAQKFGADKLPEQIKNKLENDPEARFEFIHCVKPNEERKAGMRSFRGMQFASYYVSIIGKKLLDEGGYRSMPYQVGRFITTPNETYGRGPAMLVLPDIKMLNEQEKTIIRAAHRMVDPPMLVTDDGALQPFNMRPNALNPGYLNERGEELVKQLRMEGNIGLGLELQDQKRKQINDAFLVTLFQILVDQPTMTATEAMLRAQEKGQLLAPTMGRQQSEMLGPMIERELDILAAAGQLPPMPQALQDLGGLIEIDYISPLNRAQRAEEGVAILRTLESAVPLAQIDPSALRIFKVGDTIRELAEINGVPAKLLYSPDELEQIEAQENATQQAAALLQAAPIAAQSAKGFAEAEHIAATPAPVAQ